MQRKDLKRKKNNKFLKSEKNNKLYKFKKNVIRQDFKRIGKKIVLKLLWQIKPSILLLV
jgi:hypothetical protein